RSKSGGYLKDPNRLANSGWSNPNSKTGSNGSNANSTTSLASTGRKGEGDSRSGWKGTRSLYNEEMAKRRAKGLCFKCGGKYHPTLHKCPEKSLRVLILREGEMMNEEGEIVSMEEAHSDTEEEEKEVE
ncbi:pentatricopeptide repeat-containing protein, partial [Trifolium medium]|nr:pentatricopeptide repeat-containing protein [Trifolium medium]